MASACDPAGTGIGLPGRPEATLTGTTASDLPPLSSRTYSSALSGEATMFCGPPRRSGFAARPAARLTGVTASALVLFAISAKRVLPPGETATEPAASWLDPTLIIRGPDRPAATCTPAQLMTTSPRSEARASPVFSFAPRQAIGDMPAIFS
ncbi:hypothetical protein EAS64_12750 [Trebonia kvetii]|uniref:Uncharacterized protein n=1 Tax=Trebonia kvetii TaxID=2480626 RepID=A0A6P2C210_9ACTN|nr:hypothetical protein [Trebonia kvetii]TVZ05414.1 hypothetical protein EAS64_12750 [Trebonia kvetii]